MPKRKNRPGKFGQSADTQRGRGATFLELKPANELQDPARIIGDAIGRAVIAPFNTMQDIVEAHAARKGAKFHRFDQRCRFTYALAREVTSSAQDPLQSGYFLGVLEGLFEGRFVSRAAAAECRTYNDVELTACTRRLSDRTIIEVDFPSLHSPYVGEHWAVRAGLGLAVKGLNTRIPIGHLLLEEVSVAAINTITQRVQGGLPQVTAEVGELTVFPWEEVPLAGEKT